MPTITQARPCWWISILLLAAACQAGGQGISTGAHGASPAPTVVGQREYTVQQRFALVNEGPGQPAKQNLWVALIRDFPPYQHIRSREVSPEDYTLVIDEYGNHYAEFDLSAHPPGTTRHVTIETDVVVYELEYDLSICQGELPDEFTQPELHVESANPQIIKLASGLAARGHTACEKARAFYDYVGDSLTYTYNADSWGAQAALGPMGSDCTEYASLLMALSRTQGIPARYFEGLRYLGDEAEEGARIRHAWPDLFLPGMGWVGMDPTLGRLPLNRETYFAHYTPDHIIITMGRNPSTLRGSSYWSHLYWPGDSTKITIETVDWKIELVR